MAKIDIKNLSGAVTGSMELSDEIFGIEPNEGVMSLVVRNQLANRRQGTQKTKTRSEVAGGGKRPYRQKGTGRARHGSTRSAQYVGGGIIFGPNPRSYSYTVPKKVRRLALKSALSSKVANSQLIVVEDMNLAEIKTAAVANALKSIGAGSSALVVLEGANQNAELSARNIRDVKTAYVNTINVFDILKYDSFVATKAAVEKIEEVYR
ncbi:MAG: 50S ribosomal protein L4 [Saccharofermentans sp.]|jgi:large subunit ribosomal protein L4|nr:50S ribosomal protein L4 [Mageeibacillus sp.]MCI1264455.1 50S ribosomal protein L4 [Saccharofermentans sp.]MCI1275140.1 50S ribosomal protein L4 [Saccharofermentans sp.]